MEKRMQFSKAVSAIGVRQPKPRREVVALEPRDGIFIYVIHRLLPDSADDVLIEHKVNGTPVHLLHDIDLCLSVLPFPFSDLPRKDDQKLRTSDPEGHNVLIVTHEFCVEQCEYGLHTFTVRRQFYNPHTTQQDYVESEYYKRVLIVPNKYNLTSHVNDNASCYHTDYCWEEDMMRVSQNCHGKLTSTSKLRNTIVFWLTIVISFILEVLYLLCLYNLNRSVLNLTIPELLRETVVTTTRAERRPEEDGSEAPFKGDRFCQKRDEYDVFLAYAPEDNAVCEQVKKTLSGQNLRVYDSHHDVRPGQAPLTAWDRAMEHSHGFIVIMSRHYLVQPNLMFQFQAIHNLMLEHRVREDRLLLLIAGKCRDPSTLGPMSVIDLELRHWQRNLEWWALTLKGEFSNRSVLRQLGHDLHREASEIVDMSKQLLPGLPGLVRKLKTVCGVVTRPTVILDGGSDRREEQFAQQTTEPPPAHDPRRESSDSDSAADSDYEANRLGSAAYLATEGHIDPDATTYDVFLTYCEESSADCSIARQLKVKLERGRMTPEGLGEGKKEGQGLRVYDAVQDLPPGQAEVHVVSAAADSAAYVVLLSPAYCSNPLNRRLHFPQVLHAVFTDRVPLPHVLIVHTSGMFDIRRGEEGSEEEEESESVVLPEWFQAFTNIHWSPSAGLCEEGKLRVWMRSVLSRR